MAYRFDGVDDVVEFALGPFSGYAVTGFTMAAFVNSAALSSFRSVVAFTTNAGTSDRITFGTNNANLFFQVPPTSLRTGVAGLSTSTWNLVAVTKAAGTSVPRFHFHNGTAWSHVNASGSGTVTDTTIATNDRLAVGGWLSGGGLYLSGDVACVGVKKTDSTDAAIETLSRTLFSAWMSFGFEWLIGFDASGSRTNVGAVSGGNETARTGTTLVSDPPSWSWSPPAVTPVADFSGTPLSGTDPLNVTFTDLTSNTPTSWSWTFGDGGTSTVQNPSHSYTVPGTYNVSLVATNAAGSDTETKTGYVVVSPSVTAPVADFSATPVAGTRPLVVAFTDLSA